MSGKMNFKRVEFKYLLNENQYQNFLSKCNEYIEEDEFKEFTVNNIYYDTDEDLLIRRSISKPKYKEKLRLRGYNNVDNDSQVFMEIKKKFDKVVYKRRSSIHINQVDNMISQSLEPTTQIDKEIDYFIGRYGPKPKYYIGYHRKAYKGIEDPSLRLTFDKDITYRFKDLDLRSGFYGSKLLNENEAILEIKIKGSMPLWLVEILNELKIYRTPYSKVGNIYKKEIIEKGITA